ncbi:hypothetical protein QJQ45_009534 [Haematococcus lacustris]|nr:hypothetical protein QJQ45_009534 [Haematococcus lacustris]
MDRAGQWANKLFANLFLLITPGAPEGHLATDAATGALADASASVVAGGWESEGGLSEEQLDHEKAPKVQTGSRKQGSPHATDSEPGPNTPPPAKRSKHTKAKQAAEPTKGKGKVHGKAAKAKPAPQPGRWLDRDCNAALNMQRIGESRWRPRELCWWPEQAALPAKGKEYPELGDKPHQLVWSCCMTRK